MHLDASYIERFVLENKENIEGQHLLSIYSISKTELCLLFSDSANQQLLWRIQFDAQSVFFSFPDNIHPNPKNRLDVFKIAHAQKIKMLVPHPCERSFHLELESKQLIFFKLHGRNANVVLVTANDSFPFRREIKADQSINKGMVLNLASENTIDTTSLNAAERNLKLSGSLFIISSGEKYDLVSEENAAAIGKYSDVNSAWNDFARLAVSSFHFYKKKKERLATLQAKLKQAKKLYTDWTRRLDEIEKNKNYRHLGDLIMSNLYQIKDGVNEAEVFDYIQNKNLKIALSSEKSAQENAERYYRKAKKQNIESGFLQKKIDELEEKLIPMQQQLEEVENAADFRSLKPLLEEKAEKQKEIRTIYREFQFQGFKILVGKTSTDNDELSFKIGKKDDLWLHARDVSGSHVLIKKVPGSVFPESVIEYAAKLAAWHSKRKQDSLCPVIYTERKFVRKRKGDAPGRVIVDKEKIIMVKPELPE